MLESRYEVERAKRGSDLINRIREVNPAILVWDMSNIGGEDGGDLELLQNMADDPQLGSIRVLLVPSDVIFLSHSEGFWRLWCRRNVAGIFRQPFGREEILDVISKELSAPDVASRFSPLVACCLRQQGIKRTSQIPCLAGALIRLTADAADYVTRRMKAELQAFSSGRNPQELTDEEVDAILVGNLSQLLR